MVGSHKDLFCGLESVIYANNFSLLIQWNYGQIEVHRFLKIGICYKITFKALKFNQPSYIRELLSFSSLESTLGLRSANDPYRLHEPRAVEERGFANRSFSYIAPRLYNKLPITLIDSVNTFKSHLKAFLFSRVYDLSGLTVQEDLCIVNFWCFCLFSFFNFSRALVNFGSSKEWALMANKIQILLLPYYYYKLENGQRTGCCIVMYRNVKECSGRFA